MRVMANRGELKKALCDWKGWLEKTSESLVDRVSELHLPSELCLALTGVRRSGKSFLSVYLAKGNIERTFYFNFEDPLFLTGVSVNVIDELLGLYEEETGHASSLVILDEIQNVYGWEKWVRKAVDLGKYQVIVTGSSSQLLSSEIATAISGRVIEQTVWPLSFAEALNFKNIRPESEGIWIRELERKSP